MNKNIILTAAAALIAVAAWSQGRTAREQTIMNVFGRLNLTNNPYKNLNCWTDGGAYYRPFFTDMNNSDAQARANGDTIYFCGGDLHEGGFLVAVLLNNAGKMKVADDYYPFNEGDGVEYRSVDGEKLLFFKDVRTNSAKEVWKKFDGELYDRYTRNYRRYILAGKYIPADGSSGNIVFALDKPVVSGFKSSGEKTYEFVEQYHTPMLMLLFNNKEIYKVSKTLTGLELSPMKLRPGFEDDWTKEGEDALIVDKAKSVVRLNKTAEILSDLPAGTFPLVSVEVMTISELREYAGKPLRSNLQVMRNEIYARHGYIFKAGGEMDRYFSKQDWYRPQYDDVTSKFTEIERINIALIQALEKEN